MATNFHANQYEQTFTPHRLQNWEIPKCEKGKYPIKQTGFTRTKANDRGHLLPNVPKMRTSPWGTFVGTWDMPTKIPGNRVLNPTARCEEALIKASSAKIEANEILSGSLKRCHTVEPLPVKMDAPDNLEPVGVVCEPAGGRGSAQPPCPVVETTHYSDNQPRAMSRKASADCLNWPSAKSPACKSPVGHSQSPKPVTPMCVADVNVQEDARKLISPLAEGNQNAVHGGLKTPDADLQNRAVAQPSPKDRITGMKSPAKTPVAAE